MLDHVTSFLLRKILMEKRYLKRALLGLALVIFALGLAMIDSSPRLESVKNVTLTLDVFQQRELKMGNVENEVRVIIEGSNSTQTIIFSNIRNNATYSIISKRGQELWLPSGGDYYVSCTSCSKFPVSLTIRTEIYKIGGSFIVIFSALIIGLVGGIYAMMSIVAHFMELGLKRREENRA